MKINPGTIHPLSRGVLSQLPVSALAEQAAECPASDSRGLDLVRRLEGSLAPSALEFYQRSRQDLGEVQREREQLDNQIDRTKLAMKWGLGVGGAVASGAAIIGGFALASTTQQTSLALGGLLMVLAGVPLAVVPICTSVEWNPDPLPHQARKRDRLQNEYRGLDYALDQVAPLATQVLEQGTQGFLWQEPMQEAIQDHLVDTFGAALPDRLSQPIQALKAADLKEISKSDLVAASQRLDASQYWAIPFNESLNSSRNGLAQLAGSTGFEMLASANPEQREALLDAAHLTPPPQRLAESSATPDFKQLTGQANEFARQVWLQLRPEEE